MGGLTMWSGSLDIMRSSSLEGAASCYRERESGLQSGLPQCQVAEDSTSPTRVSVKTVAASCSKAADQVAPVGAFSLKTVA